MMLLQALMTKAQIMPYSFDQPDVIEVLTQEYPNFKYNIKFVKLNIFYYNKVYYGYSVITEYGPYDHPSIRALGNTRRRAAPPSQYKHVIHNEATKNPGAFKMKELGQTTKLFEIKQITALFRKDRFAKHKALTNYINARKEL